MKKMIRGIFHRIFSVKGVVASGSINTSVRRGAWGEDMAAAYLRRIGWRIVGRNVRPCKNDRRCELDIVAYVPRERRIVFVEVKTHLRHSSYAGRLWAIDRRKKANLLKACANWLMSKKWHENYRFDVVEVYGSDEGGTPPEIDHITNVKLFPPNWRFW